MKPADYYSQLRPEIYGEISEKSMDILDVGCGEGVLGAYIKSIRNEVTVHGIEICTTAAEKAMTVLDMVIVADLNKITAEELASHLQGRKYDCIICADVLEHLINPEEWLHFFQGLLSEKGQVILSIPNIRNYRVLIDLLLNGDFRYCSRGILDQTHLRFFTTKSLLRMLSKITSIRVKSHKPNFARRGDFANTLTFGLFKDFFAIQTIVVLCKNGIQKN